MLLETTCGCEMIWLDVIVSSSSSKFFSCLTTTCWGIIGCCCWITCWTTGYYIPKRSTWGFLIGIGWVVCICWIGGCICCIGGYSINCEGMFNAYICWLAKETCLFWSTSSTTSFWFLAKSYSGSYSITYLAFALSFNFFTKSYGCLQYTLDKYPIFWIKFSNNSVSNV